MAEYRMTYLDAKKFIDSKEYLNNEYYNLNLDENALKMTGAFGGGFHVGDVCGALSGSACVISSKYIETRAHETTHLKPIMLNLVRAFQNHFSQTTIKIP